MLTYSTISEKSLTLCYWLAIITAISAPISTFITGVSSAAMLVTWLASGQALRSLKISYDQAAGKTLLLFYAWLLLGTLYADTAWSDRLQTLFSWKKLAFTFVLLGLFYQARWKRLFVKSYLIAMVIAALIAVPLWLWNVKLWIEREPGIFMTNHSSQSIAFIAATVCCVFLLKEPLSAQKKWLLGAAIGLFVFNIFFISPARSGYLAFPFAMIFAVSYLCGFKKSPYVLGAVGILLAVLVLTSTTLQQRIEQGFTEKNTYQSSEKATSIGLRMVLFKNTLALIEERPLLGYGTSSFNATYSAYVAAKYPDWRGKGISDPHNQYLFVWLENGLIGLLLFLAYIVVVIRQGLSQPPYGAMAASFLIAVCASSLFNSNFKTVPEGMLLAFFVGILLAQCNTEPKKQFDSV